ISPRRFRISRYGFAWGRRAGRRRRRRRRSIGSVITNARKWSPTMTLSETDRDALQRSIDFMLRRGEAIERRALKRQLAEATKPWEEIGRDAACSCQTINL